MASNKRVIIFTTPTCGWCRRAKEYFRMHRINFKEIDVTKDPYGVKELQKLSGQTGVPVILINNRPIVGFNKNLIDKLLDIRPA